MQGIVLRADQPHAALQNIPTCPEPGPGEVVCRTLEVGICGTDREIVAGGNPLCPRGAGHLVLGHECLAEVVAVGTGVELPSGQLVTPLVRRRLVDADPKVRVDLLSWGQYVERGIVHAHGFAVPDWIDRAEHLVAVEDQLRDVAVLTEPQSVAEKAINESIRLQNARLDLDWAASLPRTLVLGLGPIAFAAALAAIGRGWPTTIMGRDASDTYRAELATRFGADYQRLPMDRFTTNFDAGDAPFDLILECTGSELLLVQSSATLAPRGAVVWLAASRTPREVSLDVSQMMRLGVIRNHLHIGSVNAAPRDFSDAHARLDQFLKQQPAALRGLITKRVAPEESLADFERRDPQGIKVVIDWR